MKEEKKIKIDKLILTIGKKEILLTVEEAKELQAALSELFAAKEIHHWHTKEVVREGITWPYQWPITYKYGSGTSIADFAAQYKANEILNPRVTLCALGSDEK